MAKPTLNKALPYILLIGGIIGYICAFIIMWDKVKLADNPHYVPSCSLNPVISCGSVMKSKQANVFGFPNPFIGLGAYPVVAIIGLAMLAGAKFKRWFWLGLELGLALSIAFAYWLLFESVYRIKALCPYCLTIDVVETTVFWYASLYLIDQKILHLPARIHKTYGWIRRHHLDLLILWILVVTAIIIKHFWYYYGKHL